MTFPNDFPEHAQSAVIAVRVRVAAQTENQLAYLPPDTSWRRIEQLSSIGRSYVLQIFAVFAKEACNLGRARTWSTRRIDVAALEFLRQLTIDARSEYLRLGVPNMVGVLGSIDPQVMDEIKLSPEWKVYQEDLLEVAELQSHPPTIEPPEVTSPSSVKSSEQVTTERGSDMRTLSEKLDDIVSRENISHEELASRLHMGRTTYFQVKAGRAGRKARKKTDIFVSEWYQRHTI